MYQSIKKKLKSDLLLEDKFIYFGVVANVSMILMCLITNVSFTLSLTVIFAVSLAINLLPMIAEDVPQKLSLLIRMIYLFGVFISLMLLPIYFYLNNNMDYLWAAHVVVSLVFAMILLNWGLWCVTLLLSVMINICNIWLLDFINLKKIGFLFYQISIINCIWYFFYCVRLKNIINKQEELKNIALSVAHEINTPLSSCLIRIQKIQEKNVLNVKEDLFNLELKIKHSLVLVDLLNQNLNDHVPTTSIQPVSLSCVIEKALKNYPFSETEKERVNFFYQSDCGLVYADERLLEYVIYNLIKNSLFFIKKAGKGKIKIILYEKKNEVILEFKDTGYGIRREYMNKIFDRFFSRRKYGTGIGLYFCKKVITAFGGSIECDSVFLSYTKFIIKFIRAKEISYET